MLPHDHLAAYRQIAARRLALALPDDVVYWAIWRAWVRATGGKDADGTSVAYVAERFAGAFDAEALPEPRTRTGRCVVGLLGGAALVAWAASGVARNVVRAGMSRALGRRL